MKEHILRHVLKNAYEFGKAQEKAIVGKLINEEPNLKERIGDLIPEIKKTVARVNGMSRKEIEKELKKLWPESLEKEKVTETKALPPLPNAEKGRVVTRLPPEPNGYPHLGHALSFNINYLYAREYDGKVWLRFEDTNPRAEKREFYEVITENIKWLGIGWDYEKKVSDDMPLLLDKGRELIEKDLAYVCKCPFDTIKKNRFEGKECRCRALSKEKNLELWEKMLSGRFREGEAACRLKGEMKSENHVMRDPTMFRIVDCPHPLQGNKYRVYPTYDFANAVEDAVCGITHVLRSNEFTPRIELQNFIRASLGYANPEVIQYSRFNLEGSPTSKREIKKLVEEGKVTGWDDPRLSTLVGLRRRGVIPETIRDLTLQIGLSTSQPVISWELLLSHNRKHLDTLANRYFFVEKPRKIKVRNAPERKAKLRLHPSEDRGFREVETGDTFYIPGNEEISGEVRLKDLYNIRLTGKGEAEYTGDEVKKDIPKIQWVTENHSGFEMLVPGILIKDGKYDKKSLKTVKGYGEEALGKLKPGTIVQLERVGFARVDSPGVLCFTSP